MAVSRLTKVRVVLVFVATVALAPGWKAWLVPVDHDEILAAASASGAAFGVTVHTAKARGAEQPAAGASPSAAGANESAAGAEPSAAGAEPSAAGAASGEWHAEYIDSGLARMLAACGMRGFAPSLVPPDFAAHVPPSAGALRPADGYFRVETAWHWPWWRPGGGVLWQRPKG